ncbi:Isotrichodermin C-15 hydroxylase [Sphaceloma murrayae]|uniref:Isotrichodermin C-15 hydroxylase n=1 Tax=Sphaceloma murrayae TaxID=2082308 RepID=A0A2K1QR87_9PEZI|nr:Isotrichodermin C-15 hydroxylase [Sphaceloma murrayae]
MAELHISSLDWRQLLLLGAALPLVYGIYTVIYNLFFHPLRSYPGPLLNRASQIPFALMLMRGKPSWEVMELHKKYGDVVRIGPGELAYADPQAWKDMMGHRKSTHPENVKDLRYVDLPFGPDIVNSERDDHRRYRRILAHGFSSQFLMDQQPLIMSHVDNLIAQLRKRAPGSNPFDMTAWYNFTTFDIIADLTFGKPFGLLDAGEYHPWVSAIFGSLKASIFVRCANFFPPLKKAVQLFSPKKAVMQRLEHIQYVKDKVSDRLELGSKRPDYMDTILTHREKETGGMNRTEIDANANVLIIAGSETTATTLSGATYLCLTNPRVLDKVVAEVRSSFKTDEEIDIQSASKLEYMLAMFDETMRVYPPVPTTNFRRTPPEGDVICGKFVPKDTSMSIWQLALYRDPRNFKNPNQFVPERWLGDPEYEGDVKEAFNPFHLGPRACLGRNLAYAEMRVIFAKMLFNFDMKLADESQDWMDQNMYVVWEKNTLKVHLIPREIGKTIEQA